MQTEKKIDLTKERPDPDCPNCKGVGYLINAENKAEICICLLKSRAIVYLTPEYVAANTLRELDVTEYEKKNIFMLGPQAAFKMLVKSILLNTGMIYTHKTVPTFELLRIYLAASSANQAEAIQWNEILNVDILILYLVFDTPNKLYGSIIRSVIEKRKFQSKYTWIYSDKHFETEAFQKLYSTELGEFLKTSVVSGFFKKVNLAE